MPVPNGRCSVAVAIALLLGALPTGLAGQVMVGQQDTFQSGTTEGWFAGIAVVHPAPPVAVPTGGPAGAGDSFLMLTALGGNGPGSRLAAMNMSQWAGNYLAAGVSAIGMSVRNLGSSDLFLRLMFEDPVFGPPTNVAFSLNAIFLAAGGGWTDVVFPLADGALIAGLGTVEAALSNATAMRIYHSQAVAAPSPFAPIAPVVGQLGVDNISALGPGSVVPEPLSMLLLGTGLVAVVAVRRRGVRSSAGWSTST